MNHSTRRHPTRGDAARVLISHGACASVARDAARRLSQVGYRVAMAPVSRTVGRAAESAPDVVVAIDAVPPAELVQSGRAIELSSASAAERVVAAVDDALSRPFAILSSMHDTDTEMSAAFADIDVRWLVHGACETHRCASLSACDGTRTARVFFLEGIIADAELRSADDVTGNRIDDGMSALQAFLAFGGAEGARFSFSPLPKHPRRLLWITWAELDAKLAAAPAP